LLNSKEDGDFGHPFTFGAYSDAFFVMNAEKLAILAGPISTFSTSKVAKQACHNHNTQHNTQQPK
jgi:hypothetical protein